MKFVIVGAGFIGCKLVEFLLRSNHEVVWVIKLSTKIPDIFVESKYLKILRGNNFFQEKFDNLFFSCNFLVYLPSSILPGDLSGNLIFNLSSNIELLTDWLKSAARNSLKFIFISSGGAVYGNKDGEKFSESMSLNPISEYGVIKCTSEKYVHLISEYYGNSYIILRMANIYGRIDFNPARRQGVIEGFLYGVLNDGEVEVWGDGSVVRDYLYVNDAILAIVKSSLSSCVNKNINIGSGVGVSLLDVINLIKKIVRKDFAVSFKESRNFDVKRVVLNNNLANELLDWKPSISLADGIEKLFLKMRVYYA